jgi:hypothetical protein
VLTRAITDRTMVGRITEVIRAPLRLLLAIGLITFTGLLITRVTRITCGDQDIGRGGMDNKSGSTAITLCEDTDRIVFRGNRNLDNWLDQPPVRQTEAHRGCKAT